MPYPPGDPMDFPVHGSLRAATDHTDRKAHTMGMFDRPALFTDHFQEGQPFTLTDMKLGPEIRTDYGDGRPVLLKIDGKWYSIFGQGLTEQVDQMEPDDLPAQVALTRVKTRSGMMVKKLLPADPETGKPTQPSDDDEIPF